MRDLARLQAENPKMLLRLEGLILDGLGTDGAHHKQYYLHKIAELLEIDYDSDDYEEGIPG
jgi:hypothetical protein